MKQAMLKADEDGRVWLENLSKTNPGGTSSTTRCLPRPRCSWTATKSPFAAGARFEYAEVEEQEASMEEQRLRS